MAEILLCLFFLIPAMLGLSEIFHILKLYILFPKRITSYVIVYLNNENASGQLQYALEQYFWLGKKYARNIIAVSNNLDKESSEVCKKIAFKHGLIFCGSEELETVLKNLKK